MWHGGDEWNIFSDPYHSFDTFLSITPRKLIDHVRDDRWEKVIGAYFTQSAVQYLTDLLTLDCIWQAQAHIIIQAKALLIDSIITELTSRKWMHPNTSA